MSDIDCDDFGIDSAMRRARRIRWVNSRTVPYVAVDSNDTAPGLETDGYDAVADWLMSRKPWYLLDVDHDRPSPGDDITRAAFDAMDGAS